MLDVTPTLNIEPAAPPIIATSNNSSVENSFSPINADKLYSAPALIEPSINPSTAAPAVLEPMLISTFLALSLNVVATATLPAWPAIVLATAPPAAFDITPTEPLTAPKIASLPASSRE